MHEVEAEQDGQPVADDQDVLEVIGADAEQPARRRARCGRATATDVPTTGASARASRGEGSWWS
jgi:hypothetical protein